MELRKVPMPSNTQTWFNFLGKINRYLKRKGQEKMGMRAYFFINVSDDMTQDQFANEMMELEKVPEVDFVDPVVGDYDVVVMVEAPVSVEALANKIKEKPWVKELRILRIVSLFERHQGSKKELLKALRHSGVTANKA